MAGPHIAGRGSAPGDLGLRLRGLWALAEHGARVVPSFVLAADDDGALAGVAIGGASYARVRGHSRDVRAPSLPYAGTSTVFIPAGPGSGWAALVESHLREHPGSDLVVTLSGHLAGDRVWRGAAVRADGEPDAVVCGEGARTGGQASCEDAHGIFRPPQQQRRRWLRRPVTPWSRGVVDLLDRAQALVSAGFYGVDSPAVWVEWAHVRSRTMALDVWPVPPMSIEQIRRVRP